MRTWPEEFKELFEPEHVKKLSKRDKARMKFIEEYRERQKINKSARFTYYEYKTRVAEAQEHQGKANLSYKEIVNHLNTETKLL